MPSYDFGSWTTKPKSTKTTYRMEEVWGQQDVYTCVHVCAHVPEEDRGPHWVLPQLPPPLLHPLQSFPLIRFLGGLRLLACSAPLPPTGLSLRPELVPSSARGPGVCSYAPTLMNRSGGLNSGPHQALDPWSHLSAKPSFLLFEIIITTFLPSLFFL